MKKLWKIVKGMILVIYLLIAAFIILCLLNRNDYGVIELFNKNLIVVQDDDLESYKKNSLIVVDKVKKEDVKVGDLVFFYRVEFNKAEVMVANVKSVRVVNDKETAYTVKDDYEFSNDYLLGRSIDSKTYDSVGGIIKFLISRWGFLFFIILPILITFIYQIYAIIVEVKKEMNED